LTTENASNIEHYYIYEYIYEGATFNPNPKYFSIVNDSRYMGLNVNAPIEITIEFSDNAAPYPVEWVLYRGSAVIASDAFTLEQSVVDGKLVVSSFPEDQFAVFVHPTGEVEGQYQKSR